MIPQLSLLSPEMTGVIHLSMWLLSVVCGLGWLLWVIEGRRWHRNVIPAQAWLMGVVEGVVLWGQHRTVGKRRWLQAAPWARRALAMLLTMWRHFQILPWPAGPMREDWHPSYENGLSLSVWVLITLPFKINLSQA